MSLLPFTIYLCLCVVVGIYVMIFLYSNPMCLSAVFVAPVIQLQELLPADYRAPSVFWTHPYLLYLQEVLGSWCVSPASALDSAASSRGVRLPFMGGRR